MRSLGYVKSLNSFSDSSLKLMLINIQSIISKKEVFWELLGNYSPDIIAGCEIWLTSLILDNEIIPDNNYKLYRKDRKDGYGGVLLGIKSNLFSTPVDFDTSCEICAAIIQLSLNQQLVVINVYRPPNRDLEYQQELCDCICEIVRRYPNSFIFCVGDLNIPDIDWTSNSIINYQYPLDISRFILTTAAECYFTQLVNIPTRGENILDIVFTNRPSFVNYCTVVPGVSDHDAVVVSFIAKATYQNEIKHKCYLWNRGNFVDMRVAFTELSMYFCNHYCDDTPADFLWISIKGELLNLLDKYVPSKMVSCNS